MSLSVRRSLTPLFSLFLVVLIAASAAVNAQTTTGVSTARVDFGTLGRGGSAERDVIFTNPANNSTITYSITFTNVTNTSGQLTAIPSSGSIAPKSNVTIAIMLDVLSNAEEGSYNSSMVVNESTAPNVGSSSTALSALAAQVTYTVQGNAPAKTALSDVNVPLVTSILGVFALIAIAAVYVILKRK
jgi:hypothetical protein